MEMIQHLDSRIAIAWLTTGTYTQSPGRAGLISMSTQVVSGQELRMQNLETLAQYTQGNGAGEALRAIYLPSIRLFAFISARHVRKAHQALVNVQS